MNKKKQFCIRGHNVENCGRTKNRQCKDCVREDAKKRSKEIKEGIRKIQHIKQFCINGHDTFICGRDKYGECKDCIREYTKENSERIRAYQLKYDEEHVEELQEHFKNWYLENKEKILVQQHIYNENHRDDINKRSREYYIVHRDEIINRTIEYGNAHKDQRNQTAKKWAKENPEKRKLAKLKSDSERILRVPRFGQEDIKAFYMDKPKNKQVDHIIPLLGEDVCGLHVRWNLQYLSPEENNFKNNKFDGTVENGSWKKILKNFKEKKNGSIR